MSHRDFFRLSQGKGLSRDSANAGSTGMLTPSAIIILSRRGTEGETTLRHPSSDRVRSGSQQGFGIVVGQTGTCPEALESLKVKSFYGDFADGFWNFGEWDSVVTGRQP